MASTAKSSVNKTAGDTPQAPAAQQAPKGQRRTQQAQPLTIYEVEKLSPPTERKRNPKRKPETDPDGEEELCGKAYKKHMLMDPNDDDEKREAIKAWRACGVMFMW